MNPRIKRIKNPDSRLQPGCYYVRFKPNTPYRDNPDDVRNGVEEYEGTLRVVHYDEDGTAYTLQQIQKGEVGEFLYISGDLYAVPAWKPEELYTEVPPVFSRHNYRFYLRSIDLQETGSKNEFELRLRSHELVDNAWNEADVIARLAWTEPPSGGPVSDYLTGSVLDKDRNKLGDLTLYWVSFYLRRAMLEFDLVDNVRPPLNNYDGIEAETLAKDKHGWQSVFDACGWKMDLKESDQPAEPPSKIWSEAELHQALPSLRDSFDLNGEWRYHLFCVGKLDDAGRGYKFDVSGGESNTPLFESIVLAAKFKFPDLDPSRREWGPRLRDKTLDATPCYFRTAVHEVGHALKLGHNFSTAGFMATTDTVREIAAARRARRKQGNAAQNGPVDTDVIDSIDWQFAPEDLERLRHWPDQVVRPGGSSVPKPDLPVIGEPETELRENKSKKTPRIPLEFKVEPFEGKVPLGAPVRILLTLTNRSKKTLTVPRLRFKAGNISGWVKLPSEEWRAFEPLAESIDELGVQALDAGESAKGSLTLLRGPHGALFPDAGSYTVRVDLWVYYEGQEHTLKKSTTLRVEQFRDPKQKRIADLLERTEQTLVSFAIGSGEGLEKGNQAVNLALNNPVLKHHFAIVRLKRLCRNIGRVRGSLDEAVRVLADESILTPSEMAGLVGMILPSRRLSKEQGKEDAEVIESTLDNNYLKADLRYVATRIILGSDSSEIEPSQRPVDAFLSFVGEETSNWRKDGTYLQVGLPEIAALFRRFLDERIGLHPTESKELVELLLVRDTRLADAIKARLDLADGAEQRLRKAAATLGLPQTGLTRIVQRLREVTELNKDLLPKEDLFKAGELMLDSFGAVPKKGALHAPFLERLKKCLSAAGLLPPSAQTTAPPFHEAGIRALFEAVEISEFRRFLEQRVRLSQAEGKSFIKLVLARDATLTGALNAYVEDPNELTQRQLREAAMKLCHSCEGLVQIVDLCRDAVRKPNLLGPRELSEIRQLIKDCLSGVSPMPAESRDRMGAERTALERSSPRNLPEIISAAVGTAAGTIARWIGFPPEEGETAALPSKA